MDQSTSIEPATQNDIPALLALLKILFEIEDEFRCDPKKQETGLRLLIQSESSVVFVCREEKSERILGMATVQLLISTAEGGLSAQVEDVIVSPESRNRGIGGRLLGQCRVWSIKRGALRMLLAADDRNPKAERFYILNGWTRSQMRLFRKGLS